jgi:V8-like Glu-specific endopeptidase
MRQKIARRTLFRSGVVGGLLGNLIQSKGRKASKDKTSLQKGGFFGERRLEDVLEKRAGRRLWLAGRKLLLLGILIGTLVACSDRPTRNELSFITSKSEAEFMLDQNKFYCHPSKDTECMSGSLMVTFIQDVFDRSIERDDYKVGLCTGFLLENNIVATNSHCIPEDLKNSLRNQRTCENQISVSFPRKVSKTKEKPNFIRRCKKLEKASQVNLKNAGSRPDYAYFRIQEAPSWVEPFRMEEQGRYPKIGEWIQTATMENRGLVRKSASDHRFAVAVQELKSCRIIKVSSDIHTSSSGRIAQKIETDLYEGEEVQDQMITIGSACSVVPGNSGSAIWRKKDPERRVVGVLQAMSSKDADARNGFSYSVATPFSMMDLSFLESLLNHAPTEP